MTTRAEELAWFTRHAPTWEWTWARTFAKSAPHSYVIKTKHLNDEDYERAFMLTQSCGRPRKFYRRVNIELEMPDLTMMYGPKRDRQEITGFKFWPMSHQRSVSRAFNVAPLGMSYGVQDAPDTTTDEDHPFDFTAGDWEDCRLGTSLDRYGFGSLLWKDIVGERHIETLLDLGPRIGFALDLGLFRKDPKAYTAVEPSQGMLNQLLYRHQWVRDIFPMTVESYLGTEVRRFDTAVALLGTASYLKPDVIRALPGVARNVHLMHYADDSRDTDFFGPTHLPSWQEESRLAALALPGAKVMQRGRFQMVSVTR